MADDSDMDYDSDSDDECGLEEQYYSAKEASASVSIEEAIRALETVVEMDADKTKWGFKALKRIAKLLLRKDHQQAMDYFDRLLAYHGSKHITTNDVDKALESLWNQYCEIVTDADTRRSYCLTTLNLLQVLLGKHSIVFLCRIQSFPGRLTRLKWLARLAQQCSSEEHHRQLADQVDDLQQVIEDAYAMDGINSDCVNDYLVDALSLTTSLFLLKKRYAHAESNLDRLKQLAEAEISKSIECQAFIREMQARISCARGKYSESFVLLWDAKKLYEACGNAGSQRVHLHLRLLSLLLSKRNDAVRANGKEYTLPVNYAVWSDKCAMVSGQGR
ncbi:CSN-2 protein [Aphelenchoides avenae]|nr:CSN-2 protein [Aphelenchus avenae]